MMYKKVLLRITIIILAILLTLVLWRFYYYCKKNDYNNVGYCIFVPKHTYMFIYWSGHNQERILFADCDRDKYELLDTITEMSFQAQRELQGAILNDQALPETQDIKDKGEQERNEKFIELFKELHDRAGETKVFAIEKKQK